MSTFSSLLASAKTHDPHTRLIKACVAFLVAQKLIQSHKQFLSAHSLSDTPTLIIAWIMHE